MNFTNYMPARTLIAAAITAALLGGCASVPDKPAGSQAVRAKLTKLQADATLAGRAAVAVKDAELAVHTAETPQKDLELAAHRVYVADRKVDTARALAETQAAEAERVTLTAQSEKARLDSRTREANVATANAAMASADAAMAKSEAANARADTAEQKLAANQARLDADAARLEAGTAQQQTAAVQAQADELARQLALLKAQPTDRGLVLTLGDTLFATGKSELKSGATANLNRITVFMNQYPKRTAVIEGFTDSMGSDDYNNDLSQRRADSVKNYLIRQGIASQRLSAAGRGESTPVADNESAAGRQQNRRVEVVISQADVLAAN